MDKQKQIEGMAKDRVAELRLFYNFCKYNGCEEKTAEDCENCYFRKVYNRLAELEGKLRNGTLKEIPEGAVVLTGTETAERLEDLLIDFDEMSFYPATTCPNPDEYAREWKRKLMYVIGQLEKEIAEKFAEMAKERLEKYRLENEWFDEDCAKSDWLLDSSIFHCEVIGEDSLIDEICKEFTGGKECRRNERKLI